MPHCLLLHTLAQSYLSTLFEFGRKIYFVCFQQPWVKQPPSKVPQSRQDYKTTDPISYEDSPQQQEKLNQELIQELSQAATGVDLTGSAVKAVKHL